MIYTAVPGRAIPLGFLGENRVEAVVFDRTCWLTEYGPGTFELVHKRSQDTDPFPIAVTVSGGTVTWIPTESDTAYRGVGECQLSFYTPDGKLKKSEIYQTVTARSLTSPEDPPSPLEGWVEQVLAAAAGIQNMQAQAETLEPGSAAAVTKTVDPDTGVVTLTFGIPEGLKGDTGRGIASMSVLSTGEWQVVYTDGTSETVGYDVYSALETLLRAAQEAAGTASEKAAEAALSAQNAATSEDNAAESAESAASSAENAERDASFASESAQTAQEAQTAAASSASSASASASSASSAKTAAQSAQTAAESARDRAETAAQTLVLDPTLTSSTQAAQAEAAGLVRDKLDAFMAGSAELPVDVGSIQEKYVNYSTGKILNTSTAYWHVGFIKRPEGAVRVRYPRIQSTGSTDTYGIAFYSAANTNSYISGVKALRNQSSTEYVPNEVAVPSGARYVAFSVFKDTETYGAPYLYAVFDNEVLDDVSELTAAVLPDALNDAQPAASGAISAVDGTVTSTTYYDHTDYIDVSGVSKIRYTRPAITGTTATSGMAFYDSSKAFVSGVPNSTSNRATGWEWHEEAVPDGVVYARFGWWSESAKTTYGISQNFAVCDADDFDASLVGKVENLSAQVPFGAVNNPLNLHTMPENEGVFNVIRRARQFTDFIWTPAVDLPRCDMDTLSPPNTSGSQFYEGLFKAGVQYKGLPYGNCKGFFPTSRYNKADTFIGFGSTFSAFALAVRNAESIIGQESGYRTAPVRSLPFAAVCSSLACYALNVPYVETTDIPSITGMTSLGKIVNNGTRINLDILRLGDLVNEKGHHVSLITDIIRDRSGAVQYIEISEATTVGNGNRSVEGSQYGGLCRRIAFTVEDFFWRYAAYTLLRYSGIASVPYEKSPYVDVGDEIPMNPVLDLPVMPYEGEGFVYNAGYIPAASGLLISSTYYSYVRVFKDGAEIAASPFAIPADTALVAFETLGVADAGEYSAYLCNMASGENTDITTRCHWTVTA